MFMPYTVRWDKMKHLNDATKGSLLNLYFKS